jgi:hypothetical protein
VHCLREEFRAAKGQVYVEKESLSKPSQVYFREIKPELGLGALLAQTKHVHYVAWLSKSMFSSNLGCP